MNDNQKALTIAEQKLLERFIQYDERKLTLATQSILSEFRNDVFMEDVFAIIVEDVLNVLFLTEWNKTTYKKIISSAQYIFETSGCFFPANEHFLFALSIVWISYCCKYKRNHSILESDSNIRSIVNDSKTLEYSICAQFFNFFAGPAIGKSKKIEDYMFMTYGNLYRESHVNNDHITNFQTLLHFLSFTNFSYDLSSDY